MSDAPETGTPQEQGLIFHLIELRDRLLRALICVLLVVLVLLPIAGDLFELLARPMLQELPMGSTMIATGTVDNFFVPMKLAVVTAIFISIPYILFQFWSFVAPGLYRHERRLILPLITSSTLLFYAGMAFAYFVVFPIMFEFMAGITIGGVAMMPDIARYLDIVLKLFFAFGVAFEVPIVTILLVWTGMVTPEALAEKRRYIIVGAFVIGMLLTPPDVISQTLLALPMWALFELGLIASRHFVRTQTEAGEEEEGGESPTEESMDEMLDRYAREEQSLSKGDQGAGREKGGE